MTRQGYSDFGEGRRFYQTGANIVPVHDQKLIRSFIAAVDFDGEASAASAVGAALCRLLRHMWPGGKPFLPVTSTLSHGGKDSVLQFICGPSRIGEVSHERADWALQNQIVLLLGDPDIAVISLGNVRAQDMIASSFVERVVTMRGALDVQKSSGHSRVQRPNNVIFAATANQGSFSGDLLNRAWPINIRPRTDIADRPSPLGNLRHEFLPENCMAIEAELLGMVLNWIDEGRPLFTEVRHPMSACSQVVGGILGVNNFTGFLGNWRDTRATADPLKEELGIMAHTHPDTPYTAMEWVQVMKRTGGVSRLIPAEFRRHDERMAEHLGQKVFRPCLGMTVCHEGEEGEVHRYRLRRTRARLGQGEAKVRYCFEVMPAS